MIYFIMLFTTPILIALAALASKRWGSFVGGGIVGLPFISAPASIFIALEQGVDFAIATSYNSLLGFGSVSVYCLIYAYTAIKHGWPLSLSLALIGFFSAAIGTLQLPHNLYVAITMALLAPVISLALLPNPTKIKNNYDAQMQPHWKIAIQMILGGLAVFSITNLAKIIGSDWSGILLTFPIITSIMTPFAHMLGSKAAVLTIQGLLAGLSGTSCFGIIVATLLKPLGILPGYSLAILGSILTSFLTCWLFSQFSSRPLDRK